MITIISGSNRKGNYTVSFAKKYQQIVEEKGISCRLFSLTDLPEAFTFSNLYDFDNSSIESVIEDYIRPAKKIVFVVPEYNGSFPGVLKTFIDAIHPANFSGKLAAIVGVSSGRAGNLRGIDHLTSVLHHLKVEVLFNKLPISGIENLMNEERVVVDERTIELMEKQAIQLIERS